MSNSLLNAAYSLLGSIETAGYVQQTDPYSMSHLAEATREYEKNFKENKRRYDQERQDNLDLLKKMEDNEAKIMAFREKIFRRKEERNEEDEEYEDSVYTGDYIGNSEDNVNSEEQRDKRKKRILDVINDNTHNVIEKVFKTLKYSSDAIEDMKKKDSKKQLSQKRKTIKVLIEELEKNEKSKIFFTGDEKSTKYTTDPKSLIILLEKKQKGENLTQDEKKLIDSYVKFKKTTNTSSKIKKQKNKETKQEKKVEKKQEKKVEKKQEKKVEKKEKDNIGVWIWDDDTGHSPEDFVLEIGDD